MVRDFSIALALLVNACVLLHAANAGKAAEAPAANSPAYTADGRLLPLKNYREWIFLSSGVDMSYVPAAKEENNHSVFDNVFVNPEAYRAFLKSGTWPDKTMLVLEVRGSGTNVDPNKAGHFQGTKLIGTEVHVKDAARGGWSFYDLNGKAAAKRIESSASCYSCHQEHAAVDTTFVQFYPTLLPVAEQNHTLSPSFSAARKQ